MSPVSRPACILIGDDLAEAAERALHRAAALPLAARAELHLIHAVQPRLAGAALELAQGAAAATLRERADATAALARAASPESEVSVATHVCQGSAFVEIIRHARVVGAELVVLGRHRPRRFGDALLGSTAERVVRKGDVPLLLATGRGDSPYRRILAAVDLGDASRRVVELAASLAHPDSAITLVHAYEVPFETTLGARTVAEVRRAREREAVAAGETLRASLTPLGVDCRLVLRRGEPALAILREAVRSRADLVVTGTHGRSGVSHALLGSVAESLVRAAPCDVAVTRPERFTFELP